MENKRFYGAVIMTLLLLIVSGSAHATVLEPEIPPTETTTPDIPQAPDETPPADIPQAPNETPPAETPPSPNPTTFYVTLKYAATGPLLKGFFPDYTETMRDIQCYYSFNDQDFFPIDCYNVWEKDAPLGVTIAEAVDTPLTEYLNDAYDTIYLQLRYNTPNGAAVSQTAQITRPTTPEPLTEDLTLHVRYPLATTGIRPYHRYHITVKQNATTEEIRALLPDTLPVELQLLSKDELVAKVYIAYQAQWMLPELIPDDGMIEDAVTVTPPSECTIKALNAIYAVTAPPRPENPLHLFIHTASTETPMFQVYTYDDVMNSPPMGLFVDFPLKPSGATEIIPAYSLDGGQTWIEIENLLSYN
ncbi:MAG: hypothetical protein RR053_05185, partial [Evtepia sp.]